MKWRYFLFQSSKEPWFEEGVALYTKKIKAQIPFELVTLKSPKMGRDQQSEKIKKEEKLLLSRMSPEDYLVLFDETGEKLDSLKFASELQKKTDQGQANITFLIGGAFGVSEEVKSRAHWRVNLSPMTLNHHVAAIVGLEQLYRALAINKNLPYHNT